MKKSIRKQIVTAFLSFVLLSIALIVLANYGLMEKVYLNKKKETLKAAYNEIILNYASVDESDLTRFCSANNVSAVIYNINTRPIKDYSNLRIEDANRLRTRLFGYIAGLEPEGDQIYEKMTCIRSCVTGIRRYRWILWKCGAKPRMDWYLSCDVRLKVLKKVSPFPISFIWRSVL